MLDASEVEMAYEDRENGMVRLVAVHRPTGRRFQGDAPASVPRPVLERAALSHLENADKSLHVWDPAQAATVYECPRCGAKAPSAEALAGHPCVS